ncbi:MAG: hypothetical protein RMI91_13390 [Gemmatales bacterium]|nr:hypothetical protein [Gemmatales bacterium]MDW7995639.1 hypothetical protein [Gemmatales bacterium]
MPARPRLLAGAKAYAPASSDSSISPLRWLRQQPLTDGTMGSAAEALYSQLVFHTSQFWREYAMLGDLISSSEPAVIGKAVRQVELPAEAVPMVNVRGRPPLPPLPVTNIQEGKK